MGFYKFSPLINNEILSIMKNLFERNSIGYPYLLLYSSHSPRMVLSIFTWWFIAASSSWKEEIFLVLNFSLQLLVLQN